MTKGKEYCIECECGTEKAGEDSLYFGEYGPLCDDCYENMRSRFLDKWPKGKDGEE